MIGIINSAQDLLNGKLSDIIRTQITMGKDDNTQILLSVLTEKQQKVPVIIESNNITNISDIDLNYIDINELEFWDNVTEDCAILAKVVKNCSSKSKTKIFDLGMSYFGLSRTFRRQIPDYENSEQYNIFVDNVKLKLEILFIKK